MSRPRAIDTDEALPTVRRRTLVPVTSSSIRALAYDPAACTLVVEFVRGQAYRYADVPGDVYADLLASPSIGRAVQQACVANPAHPVERVRLVEDDEEAGV